MRTPPQAALAHRIAVVLAQDGRVYVANIRVNAGMEDDVYQSFFTTEPYKWTDVHVRTWCAHIERLLSDSSSVCTQRTDTVR